MTDNDDPDSNVARGYNLAKCKHCGVTRGDHDASDVARNAKARPHAFEPIPGDEWCGWCDDWAVNCNCADEDEYDEDDDREIRWSQSDDM